MHTDGRGPLAGVRIIDITTMILGPVATMLLADMGAEVIHIEPPEGDAFREVGDTRSPGMSAAFLAINRNKSSVVLDLKSHAGLEDLAWATPRSPRASPTSFTRQASVSERMARTVPSPPMTTSSRG
jgi:hypothetical protein